MAPGMTQPPQNSHWGTARAQPFVFAETVAVIMAKKVIQANHPKEIHFSPLGVVAHPAFSGRFLLSP